MNNLAINNQIPQTKVKILNKKATLIANSGFTGNNLSQQLKIHSVINMKMIATLFIIVLLTTSVIAQGTSLSNSNNEEVFLDVVIKKASCFFNEENCQSIEEKRKHAAITAYATFSPGCGAEPNDKLQSPTKYLTGLLDDNAKPSILLNKKNLEKEVEPVSNGSKRFTIEIEKGFIPKIKREYFFEDAPVLPDFSRGIDSPRDLQTLGSFQEKHVFNKALDLEVFLATHDPTSLGANPSMISCALGFPQIKDQDTVSNTHVIYDEEEIKTAVSHYYAAMNRLRLGQLAALESLTAIEVWNANTFDPLDNSLIKPNNPLAPELTKRINEINQNPPEFSPFEITQETHDLLQKLLPVEQEIKRFKDDAFAIGVSGAVSPLAEAELDDIGEKILTLREQARTLKSVIAPWTLGEVFQENHRLKPDASGYEILPGSDATLSSLQSAITLQLDTNKQGILQFLNQMQDSSIALNDPEAEYKEVKATLDVVLDPSKIPPLVTFDIDSALKENDPDYLRKVYANTYLQLSEDQRTFKSGVTQAFWDDTKSPRSMILMTAGLFLTGFAAGPFAAYLTYFKGAHAISAAGRGALAVRSALGLGLIATDLAFTKDSFTEAQRVCDETFFEFNKPLGDPPNTIEDLPPPARQLANTNELQPIYNFGPQDLSEYKQCVVAMVFAGIDIAGIVVPEAVGEFLGWAKKAKTNNPAENLRIDRAKRVKSASEDIRILNYYDIRKSYINELLSRDITEENIGSLVNSAKKLLEKDGTKYNIFGTQNRAFLILPEDAGSKLNQFAVSLKTKFDVDLVIDFESFKNNPSVGGFLDQTDGKTRVLVVHPRNIFDSSGAVKIAKDTFGHEIFHIISHGFNFRGEETFLSSRIAVDNNPHGIRGSYSESFSFDEITARLYELRLNLQRMQKNSNNILRNPSDTVDTVTELAELKDVVSRLIAGGSLIDVGLVDDISAFSLHSADVSDKALEAINKLNARNPEKTSLVFHASKNGKEFARLTEPDIGIECQFAISDLGNGNKVLEVAVLASQDDLNKGVGWVALGITDPDQILLVEKIVGKTIDQNTASSELIKILQSDTIKEGTEFLGVKGQLQKINENSRKVAEKMDEILEPLTAIEDASGNLRKSLVEDNFDLLAPKLSVEISEELQSLRQSLYSFDQKMQSWNYGGLEEVMFPKFKPTTLSNFQTPIHAISPSPLRQPIIDFVPEEGIKPNRHYLTALAGSGEIQGFADQVFHADLKTKEEILDVMKFKIFKGENAGKLGSKGVILIDDTGNVLVSAFWTGFESSSHHSHLAARLSTEASPNIRKHITSLDSKVNPGQKREPWEVSMFDLTNNKDIETEYLDLSWTAQLQYNPEKNLITGQLEGGTEIIKLSDARLTNQNPNPILISRRKYELAGQIYQDFMNRWNRILNPDIEELPIFDMQRDLYTEDLMQ